MLCKYHKLVEHVSGYRMCKMQWYPDSAVFLPAGVAAGLLQNMFAVGVNDLENEHIRHFNGKDQDRLVLFMMVSPSFVKYKIL